MKKMLSVLLCCAVLLGLVSCGGNDADNDGNIKNWNEFHIPLSEEEQKLQGGKIFIEYEPIETAWVPISGRNYEYIYCLWVDVYKRQYLYCRR